MQRLPKYTTISGTQLLNAELPPPKFTLAEHQEIGTLLKHVKAGLMDMMKQTRYKKDHKRERKAYDLLNKFKCEMDELLFRDCEPTTDCPNLVNVYYGEYIKTVSIEGIERPTLDDMYSKT